MAAKAAEVTLDGHREEMRQELRRKLHYKVVEGLGPTLYDRQMSDAEAAGLTIELVIETHFHADFLSGHLELAAATGAEIGFASVAETEFALFFGALLATGVVFIFLRRTRPTLIIAAAVISQYCRKYIFDNEASPSVTTPFEGVIITNKGQKNSFQVHIK